MKVSKNKNPVSLSLTALSGIPLVRPGDDLVEIIMKSLKSTKMYISTKVLITQLFFELQTPDFAWKFICTV